MSFLLAAPQGQSMAEVRVKPIVAAGAWLEGAPLVVDANGNYAEAGADPALIYAFSTHDVGTGSGSLYPVGTKEFPPGKCIGVRAEDNLFAPMYTGTLPANAGGDYGVTKGADGIWRVDFAKTGASARVRLVSIDWTTAPLSVGKVLVRVLPANVGVLTA